MDGNNVALESGQLTSSQLESDQSLRQSLQAYRALAEISASVIFRADLDGRFTEFPLVLGLAPTSDLEPSRRFVAIIHPDDRHEAFAAWRRAISMGSLYRWEFRILMQNNRYRWHLATAVQVLDENGTPREWIGSCADIHHRTSRQRILRLLDAFTSRTRDMKSFEEVAMLGQEMLGVALAANRVAYSELRNGSDNFVSVENYCNGCADLQGKLPVTGPDSKLSQELRRGQLVACDDVNDLPDSDSTKQALLANEIASMIVCPVLKDNKVVAILGVHQTTEREWSSDEVEMVQSMAERVWSEAERVKAEHERLLSSQRLRSILEAATVGVIVNNSSGTLTYANAPLLRILGYTSDEILRGEVTWERIQPPERIESDYEYYRQLLRTGQCEPYETLLLRKDGSRVHVYMGAALVPDEGGGGWLGAAFVTDLTQLKSVEDELRDLNSELEERVEERTAELRFANRELEGFTYSVSHDLRAPLRSIVAASRILLEDAGDKLTGQEKSLLEQQARSASKLGVLIDDLLKLSRLSRAEVEKRPIDMSDLGKHVAAELLSKEWQTTREIEIQPDMHTVGDAQHVQLLLLNLFDNACKFSASGGRVRFGKDGDVFFVTDEGIGFDMAYAEKLFVPFERLVREAEFPGTGVGLANVQRIVQRHGGRVWAESSPGNGATFYFTLPE